MTPGFNCVKEMLLPEVAEAFQKAGITALIYDPRSIGLSDGLPRNEIDPVKQTEDYSDALTYLTSLPMIDANRVGFWGMSFSGMIALSAAALDKRAKFVIVVCSLVKFYNPEKVPKALAMAIKDRQSQLRGNGPFYLPPFTSQGSNPLELAAEGGVEAYNYMVNVKHRGAPNYEDRTTIQSYAKIAKWQPHSLMKFVDTPVLGLVPEFDNISPTQQQLALFEELSCPKKVHVAKGKGHLNIMSGDDFDFLQQVQVDFLTDVLARKFK
ncbi:Polyketide transferase [Lasiodiplodia hormozganensis]|uniref:Polyketide transferase n=1 Tax=Lasiodiplodia hormozganensis TaxID=869390 RepID=A0AA39XQ34_9PEZI|nr:Polyketide transferase [Lasiodiplodia hormozganensis]